MSFCLCSLVFVQINVPRLLSLSLSRQLRPARGAQPNWWQNIPCSIKTGKFLLVGGSSLSLSLPAPPEPAPACLVAEEEAATSDRVPGSEVCTQCSHSSVHSTHSPACRGRHITLKSSLIGFQTLNELFHFRLIFEIFHLVKF